MQIKITGKELKITEAINDYVERKLDRIDKYFEDAEAEVTLKTEKNGRNDPNFRKSEEDINNTIGVTNEKGAEFVELPDF